MKYQNIFIYIIILHLIFIVFSCSNIKYYTSDNRSDHYLNISEIELKKQTNIIKNANPEFDSLWSHNLGDNRLVTLMNVGEYFPGVDTEKNDYKKFGSKSIWGTTDNELFSDLE